jgi:hypothetical protein
MAINGVTMECFFIEKYDDCIFSFSNNGTSGTKRNVLSLSRVDIHDSIADLETEHIVRSSLRSEPHREHLLINHTNGHLHNF